MLLYLLTKFFVDLSSDAHRLDIQRKDMNISLL